MTEGTCVDEALGAGGAKVEAQEPWCKQERFLNHKDSQIFETKINVALRRSTECWRTGRSQHCAKFKFENLKLIQTFNVMKSGFDRSICSAFKLTLLWTWKCNIFGSRRNIFLNFSKTVSIADFQNSVVPEFCVNANIYVEGSEGRSRILDVIIFIGPYSKSNKLDSQP